MTDLLFQVKGFTPCIDVMIKKYGLVTAAVYGRVWRFCQMDDRICNASHQRIADDLSLNRRTVLEHLKKLCDLGFLEDTTPDLRNKPHIYKDTGKAKILGMMGAGVDGVNETPNGVNLNQARCESNSHEDSIEDTTEDTSYVAPATYQEWHSHIEKSKNRQAALKHAFEFLYPGRSPPKYSYFGSTARQVGGAGRLFALMWAAVPYQPQGDILGYCQGMAKNGAYKRDSAAPQQSTNPNAPGYVIPVLEFTGESREQILADLGSPET